MFDSLHMQCNPDDPIGIGKIHKHLCECGCCWKHDCLAVQGNSERFNSAHTCPQCGSYVDEKHYTPEEEAERIAKECAFIAKTGIPRELLPLYSMLRQSLGSSI